MSRYDTPSVRRRTTAFLLVAVTLSDVVFAPPTSSSARVRACAAQVPAVTKTGPRSNAGTAEALSGLTTDQLNTSTSSGTPFLSSLASDRALLGHWPTHTPQPMHLSQSRVERSSPKDRAWNGQVATHLPQATHTPASVSAT